MCVLDRIKCYVGIGVQSLWSIVLPTVDHFDMRNRNSLQGETLLPLGGAKLLADYLDHVREAS